MSKWARIENGVVAEVIEINPAGRFPEDWVWVSCPDDVKSRWTYDEKGFRPEETPTFIPEPKVPPELIGSELNNDPYKKQID